MKRKIDKNFISIYITFLAIALTLQQFLPSYLKFSSLQAISFRTDDGWCKPKIEGIGTHCFGDYYFPLTFVNDQNPWKGVMNPYPPLSLVYYKPFSFIAVHVQPRIALVTFLLLLVAALLFPIVHLWRVTKEISFSTFSILLLTTVLFAPALVSVDRGNNQLLVLPPLYLFYRAYESKNFRRMCLYALICMALKPQFVLLAVLIFQIFGYRKTLKYMCLSVGMYVLSFLIYSHSFPINIFYWIYKVQGFQDYADRGVLMPVNMSLKSDIDIGLNAINANISLSLVKATIFFVYIVLFLAFMRNIRIRSNLRNFTIVLLFPILFSGTTFHYYLSMLLIPFTLFLVLSIENKPKGIFIKIYRDELEQISLSSTLPRRTLLVCSILSFVPWGIPWIAFFPTFKGRGWEVIGINWLPAQYSVLLLMLVLLFSETLPLVRIKRGTVTP